MAEVMYCVMRHDHSKHGVDYYPTMVFTSEMEAGKWLDKQPDYKGAVEFEIMEVPRG